jgi:hypothetical protein
VRERERERERKREREKEREINRVKEREWVREREREKEREKEREEKKRRLRSRLLDWLRILRESAVNERKSEEAGGRGDRDGLSEYVLAFPAPVRCIEYCLNRVGLAQKIEFQHLSTPRK